MPRTVLDVDALAALPEIEINARLAAALERVESRSVRATAENRDFTDREAELSDLDRREMTALRDAIELRSQNVERGQRMSAAVAAATGQAPRDLGSGGALEDFAAGLAAGVPTRAVVETRSVTTANAGARGGVATGALGRPQWIWEAAAIPFTPATTLTVAGPKFAALVARAATAEGGDKPPMTDPTLAEETLRAFAVVEEISDQVVRFGVGAQAVTDRLAAEVVFSVNAAFADALEAAAGAVVAYSTSPSHMADAGIAKVWARTGAKPTALLVNSADYPLLSAKAAVGPGDGIAAEVVYFNGTRLLVNDAVTAGVGVVFNGRAFSAHATDVLLASLPNLDKNTIKLRAETYAALLQHDAGAIVAVDLAA